MTIAVTNIGTNGAIALGVSASVGAGGVPSGSLIVVCVQDTTVGAANGTVSDTAGNTYTLAVFDQPNNSTTNGSTQLFYAWNCSALVSGNSITYTGTDASRSKCISASYATGIQTSSDPLIGATVNTATGTSQTLSVTSGSPGVAGALFVACVGRNNPTGATFTQDTAHGWSNPPNNASEGSGSPHSGVNCGSQVNAANSTLTFAPGWSTTANQAILIAAFSPAPSSTAYTLTAAVGSFTLSGVAASLKSARKLAASVGTFALTGQAVGLKSARKLTAAAGSFALSGQAVALSSARKMAAAAGAFTLTGVASALKSSRKLGAQVGAFSLTGIAAALTPHTAGPNAYTLTAQAAAFLLSGQIAGLRAARKVSAAVGSFALSGVPTGLRRDAKVSANAASFTLSGQVVAFHAARKLSPASGAFTLTGMDADLISSGAAAELILNPAWLITSESRTRTLKSSPRRRTITSRK